MAAGFWYVMLRESEVFVYYFDVLILLCCRWEFSVAVPLGMNVFLNAELLNYNAPFRHKFNSSAFKKTFMPNGTATENSHRQHNNIRTSK